MKNYTENDVSHGIRMPINCMERKFDKISQQFYIITIASAYANNNSKI